MWLRHALSGYRASWVVLEAQQMTADTYRIVARGNGFTGSHAVQDFTILKAAETAKKAGAAHISQSSAHQMLQAPGQSLCQGRRRPRMLPRSLQSPPSALEP